VEEDIESWEEKRKKKITQFIRYFLVLLTLPRKQDPGT
jgi:hypothetical protein